METQQPGGWTIDRKVRLEGLEVALSRPVLVASGRGHLWFPTMARLAGGGLLARMSTGADAATNTLENEFFKVTIDPKRGTIQSLIDKHSERELVDASSPYGLGQYLYECFDADQVANYVKSYVKIKADWAVNELGKPPMPPATQVPYSATSPRDFHVEISRGDHCASASVSETTNPDLPRVMSNVNLYSGLPYVEIVVSPFGKGADTWPEAGWLCLPLKVDQPQFRLARLGSIIDPATDIVPGSNRHILALNGGLAITDPTGRGVGIGLGFACSPLVSLDTPGLWKYSLDFIPKKPTVFVNLFNNQWTTNFRMWNTGNAQHCVRIWSIDQYSSESSLFAPSQESRVPLLAAAFDGPAGKLPPRQSGLELSRRGVAVTSFGPNPDGPGTILRLWELAGQSSACEIRLPVGLRPDSVQPVNLRGQAIGQPIAVIAGRFTIDLRAFAPATVLLS